MSKIELLAKIELLNKYEAMIEEMKEEADKVRNSIKAEMEQREVEELIAGQYIVRWTSVLSNRFDSTAFKKVTTVIETSPQFYGWLCGLGRGVRVVSPPEVVEAMGNYVKGIAEMY